MAIYKSDIADIELENGNIHRTWLNHSIGLGDVKANRFGVRLFRNKVPEPIGAATLTALFMAPNGQNQIISESGFPGCTYINENIAFVTLPSACYAEEGQFCLALKLNTGGTNTTMRIIDGIVANTGVTGAVVPSNAVPTGEQILAAYEEAVAVISYSVRYDMSQSMTETQKTTARTNIAAASQTDLEAEITNRTNADADILGKVVRTDIDQDLSATQKTKARTNIAAASQADLAAEITNRTNADTDILGKVVRTDTDQSLTAVQKTKARTNIAAASQADLEAEITNRTNADTDILGKVVRTDIDQDLSATQKTKARTNIAAASQADLEKEAEERKNAIAANILFRGNYYNLADTTQGYIITDDDIESALSNYSHTDYIPVLSGEKYITNLSILTSFGLYYNTGKVKVGKLKNIAETENGLTVITMPNDGYIRVNLSNTNLYDAFICTYEQKAEYREFNKLLDGNTLIDLDEKYSDIFEPSNLYDKDGNLTPDTIISNSGETSENANFDLTDYIEVTPGVYTVSHKMSAPGCFYNSSKQYISVMYKASLSTMTQHTFIIPNGVRYVRMNVPHNVDFIFCRGKYLAKFKYGELAPRGMYEGKNIFKNSGLTYGKLLMNDGTISDAELYAGYAITDYIPIPGMGEYTVPYSFSSPGCIYDESKTWLAKAYNTGSTGLDEFTFNITNPNAKYIRLNLLKARANDFFLIEGKKATGAPYNVNIINGLKIRAKDVIGIPETPSRWSGKTIACFGDSRTWYDGKAYGETTKSEWEGKICKGYIQTLSEMLNADIINEGVSGETSAQICERIRDYDFTEIDAVFLEGGVNDFVKSSQVTIGSIQSIGSTFDTTTVYGAWQSAIEYILENYPKTLIYVDVPAIAWIGETAYPYEIAEIKKEIAELYNLPCINLYNKGGISTVNRDYWYADDVTETNWRLHFNDYGNELIGAKIAKFIETQ